MNQTRYRLKAGTFLAKREGDLALFHVLGNHVYLRDNLVDSLFEEVCRQIEFETLGLAEICETKEANSSSEAVRKRIGLLKDQRLLVEFPKEMNQDAILSCQNSFLSHFYNSPYQVNMLQSRLKTHQILVINLLSEKPSLESKLRAIGFEKVQCGSFKDMRNSTFRKETQDSSGIHYVVVGSWTNAYEIREINNFFYSKNQAWLLILDDLFGGEVGPFFSGIDGPCFSCMLTRKRGFLEGNSGFQLIEESLFRSNLHRRHIIKLPSCQDTLYSLASTELFKLVTDLPSPKIHRGSFLVDSLNFKIKYNEVFPVAFCETCSHINENPIGGTLAKWRN